MCVSVGLDAPAAASSVLLNQSQEQKKTKLNKSLNYGDKVHLILLNFPLIPI